MKHVPLYLRSLPAIEKSTNFINKIKPRQLACTNNRAKSIPDNTTIRKEYIKCGKQICEQKQRPYQYMLYWKDPESKKLKKNILASICQTTKNC
jgi:hypothetical protein